MYAFGPEVCVGMDARAHIQAHLTGREGGGRGEWGGSGESVSVERKDPPYDLVRSAPPSTSSRREALLDRVACSLALARSPDCRAEGLGAGVVHSLLKITRPQI